MPTQFTKCVNELGLGEYHDFLMSVSRPSIELLNSHLPVTAGCSKFGGNPDVPKSFVWPKHKIGEYRFIGQINLADVPNEIDLLPRTGLLSFFYAYEEDGAFFWGDPEYIRAFHFDPSDDIQPLVPPTSVQLGATCRIALDASRDVPEWSLWRGEEWLKNWPIDESLYDPYGDLRLRLHPSSRYLLGYPLNMTLAYDPTPGPDWQSILTLNSEDDFEWCWHDGDRLVTFIEQSCLQSRDFSDIKADAG